MNINLHTLTSYPASLFNRDFQGHAKTMQFGNSLRTRISSQAVKLGWKETTGPWSLKDLFADETVRSRVVFKELIGQHLVETGHDPEMVANAALPWIHAICGRSETAEKNDTGINASDPLTALERKEAVSLTEPEIRWLRARIVDCIMVAGDAKGARDTAINMVKAQKDNLKALGENATIETTLTGRLTTGDVIARTESALWVSHRFSVNRHERSDDCMAMTDSILTPRLGSSATLATQPLVSGLFYGADILSLPVLISNLTGRPQGECRSSMPAIASKIIEHWIMAAFHATPKGKRTSTNATTKPGLLMVEFGDGHQHNMARAFETASEDATLQTAAKKLATYIGNYDDFEGSEEKPTRLFACIDPEVTIPGATRMSVREIAKACASCLPIEAAVDEPTVVAIDRKRRKKAA